ncbi:MAG: hypothetical protein QCI82_03020 [Candidatus Thermoplasmatota archaeon]|nr:hypothetical protein [Candidatus Thermoplasmatota archaeon]
MDIPIMIWVLSIGVPIIVGLLASCIIWISYHKALDHFRERRIDVSQKMGMKRSHVIVLNSLALVPFFLGVVPLLMLAIDGEVIHPYQETVMSLVGYVICVPVSVSMVSMAISASSFMNEHISGPRPEHAQPEKQVGPYIEMVHERSEFSRSTIMVSIPQTISTYAMLMAIFLLVSSGIIQGKSAEGGDRSISIDEGNIGMVRIASWAFVALSSLSLPGSFLPLLIKGSVMNNHVFFKRLSLAVTGTMPSILGMVLMIISMSYC